MKKQKSGKTVSILIISGTIFVLAFVIFFLTFGMVNFNSNINESPTPNIAEADIAANAPAVAPTPSPSVLPYIALTFDDGPYEPTTKKILNVLKKHDIHATFFTLGYRVETSKDLICRMSKQGHEIGIHSWDHPNYTTLNPTQIKQQQEKCSSVIESYTGKRPLISRPPYGGNDKKTEKACGTPIVLWSVDSVDWKETDRNRLVKRIVNNTFPGDIVLMHDLQKITSECIEEIVSGLIKKGLKPVTVSELIAANKGTTLQKNHIYYSANKIKQF